MSEVVREYGGRGSREKYCSGDAISASSSSYIRSLRFACEVLPLGISIVLGAVGLEANIMSCEGPGLIDRDEVDEEAPTPA
jgi:hypothetical protein